MKSVLLKRVGKTPIRYEIGDGVKAMQEIVGGYIELVRLPNRIDMWLNEEGLLEGLPLNIITMDDGKIVHHIVGDVFFTSYDDEGDSISINDEQVDWIVSRLSTRGAVINKDDSIHYVHNLKM